MSKILISEDYQVLNVAAEMVKEANGEILAFSGRGDQGCQLLLEGNSANFTGDNIAVTGPDAAFYGVTSQHAEDRALKGTGARTQIFGGVWQTDDQTGAGYDLEFVTGGAYGNDYNVVVGIGTSQATGGILLGELANAVILGSQFGKLTAVIGDPETPDGLGRVVANRITGDITIGKSFAQIDLNAIGTVDAVFGNGTDTFSGHYYGPGNNIANGSTFEIKAGVQESRFWLHQVYEAGITPIFGANVLVNNDIWHGRIGYTPTFGAAGGSPTIGTTGAVIEGNYSRAGREVFVDGRIHFGTGANFGSGYVYVTLPFNSAFRALGNGMAVIGGTSYLFSMQVGPGDDKATLFNVTSPTALASASSPAAWAAGDDFWFQMAYTLVP
jgi:hypothetical protein